MATTGSFSTDKVGIAHLLKNTNIIVPQYQRSYAWEERHVIDFLDDIERAVKGDAAEYFLGSVVLAAGSDSKGRPEVVDGQQRLATTTLLIAEVRNHFAAQKKDDKRHNIDSQFLMSRDLRDDGDIQKLELNERDNEFFLKLVLRPEQKPPVPQRDSHRAIQDASKLCRERVEKLVKESGSDDILIDLVEYLRDKARVIALTVPSDENAFVLFETLNDRGLDLALSDLLKNYLFRIAGTRLAEVRASWVAMYSLFEATGTEGLVVDFIRQVYSSRNGITREKELFAQIKKTVTGRQNAVELAEDLRRSAVAFQALLSPSHLFWQKFSPSSARHIETLNFLGLTRIRPLLLAIIEKFDQKNVETALKRAVSWAVRLVVVGGVGSGSVEEAFCQRAKEVRSDVLKDAEALSTAIETVIPNDITFSSGFETTSISKSKVARYLLRSLEIEKSGEKEPELIVNSDPTEVNLEHVLPQSHDLAKWPKLSADTAALYAYRLGNMVLLKKSENEKLGDGSFSDKKPILAASSLLLTKEVALSTDWGEAEIKARQLEMAKSAIKVWALR